MFAWAKAEGIPVLSTVLRVRRNERGPLADVPHCVEGTQGERKIPRTILPRRIDLGLRNTTDLPNDLFDRYQQVIVEKRHTDIFAHARIERLLTELSAGTFVVFGVGLAHGIAQAAIGLRSRGFGVILAEDAVLDLGDDLAPMAARRMEAKGVIFVPAREIVCPKPKPRVAPFREALPARK
ncbi:MAG: hypothetical protein AMK72_11075 [Planctomycetes bacterium SM23_25]|nr:MAG: hypothetical protein AMK72_11075 [Planctomycetes bacterium SM23_25]